MRAIAILVASILAFGGLAGCMGAEKETPKPATPTPGGGEIRQNSLDAGPLKVLAPLASTVTIDAPAWIQSGTEVPVKASAPANAKGAVTYAWAIGALPGTTDAAAAGPIMDTGSKGAADQIAPGGSKTLTYSVSGVYGMHCHPHPFMLHNVTVIDGYATKDVEVNITDGDKKETFRFVPENIVVGKGTKVTYKNVGKQPHTATAMAAPEPALKLLPLKAENGTVKIEGEGWLRVLAITQDAEGRVGIANKSIYATSTLPAFAQQTLTFEFTHGTPAPLAGTPVEAGGDAKPLMLEHPGKVTLNYTFSDAVGGASGENLAQVEIHLTKDGETQDTLTAGPDPIGTAEGKAIAGAYTLTVVPLQGAQVSGSVVVDVVYDLVPPAPATPAAGGHDDSGGGGHHH